MSFEIILDKPPVEIQNNFFLNLVCIFFIIKVTKPMYPKYNPFWIAFLVFFPIIPSFFLNFTNGNFDVLLNKF
mgnify:CR=1 FL=1